MADPKTTPSHVIVNKFGHWCAECGEALDWDDDCPTCGGDGFEDEDATDGE